MAGSGRSGLNFRQRAIETHHREDSLKISEVLLLRHEKQVLRRVYPERNEWAQGDTGWLHSNFVEHGEVDEEVATLTKSSGH